MARLGSESLHRLKKKCKKVHFFCDLFCRLKKNAYLCVNNKGEGLHPSSDPKQKNGQGYDKELLP